MTLPTAAQLCDTLGGDLTAYPGFVAPAAEVTAVHVSELTDPTAYLFGGELLLTTGLALPASGRALRAYAARLRSAGTVALAFGVGPVHDEVPPGLVRACRAEELPLLVVPPPTPFLAVTHAYWLARTASDRVELSDAVSGHHALVRAMLADDPAAEVVRTLSLALRSWVAVVDPAGTVRQVHPSGRVSDAGSAVGEAGLGDLRDVHSTASFAQGDDTVVVFPIPLRDKVTGYVTIGSDHRLSGTERRLVFTATALLSLEQAEIGRREEAVLARRSALAELLDLGLVEAARRLASRTGDPVVGDRVRVLVVRSGERGHPPVADAVLRWSPTALPGGAARSGPGLREQRSWFVVEDTADDVDALRAAVRAVDDRAAAVLSRLVPTGTVHDVRAGLWQRVTVLDAGDVVGPRPPASARTAGALDRLTAYRRADLVASLAAYLRHRGAWDAAARELGVHRNTLRHRVERVRAETGLDVDDPDVAAELWLELRATGRA